MDYSQQVETFDYVIFGATGDLTTRKLLPAFYNRFRAGQIPDDARIIGTARTPLRQDEYVDRAREALVHFLPPEIQDQALIEKFLSHISYVTLDGTVSGSEWEKLKDILTSSPPDRIRVYYFATAPQLYGAICENLSLQKLISPFSRVVLEKPIGTDSRTAQAINDGVGQHFPENHIFRIDHYLGKETVQNIMALRFANPLIEAVWSGKYIDNVQITAAETVGVEGRAAYYNTSGALRDMIQNHLLQVLALVAMEPPASLEADSVRNAKLAALDALQPITGDAVLSETVRAQYTSGVVAEHNVPGYVEELGEPSNTETYALLRARVATKRWEGVPFYLRTAKRSAKKVSEVVITFKAATTTLFGAPPAPTQLIIRVQPHEGVSLSLNVKNPLMDGFVLQKSELNADFKISGGGPFPDSYERLLLDAVRGDPVLFIRRDEVEAAWRWVEPVLQAWAENRSAMTTYSAGTYGPKAADDLLAENNHLWHEKAE